MPPKDWDEHPDGGNEDIIILMGKMDGRGNQMFKVRWYDDKAFAGPWMSQIFFTNVDEFKNKMIEKGRKVKIVNKITN